MLSAQSFRSSASVPRFLFSFLPCPLFHLTHFSRVQLVQHDSLSPRAQQKKQKERVDVAKVFSVSHKTVRQGMRHIA